MPGKPDEETTAASQPGAVPRGSPSTDGHRILEVLSQLVGPLSDALPEGTDVMLHDLTQEPGSTTAASAPSTDAPTRPEPGPGAEARRAAAHVQRNLRKMRSTTILVRDQDGEKVAALCVNTDITPWLAMRRLADAVIGGAAIAEAEPHGSGHWAPPEMESVRNPSTRTETFVQNVEDLAAVLIHEAIVQVGVPVELMKKEHKIRVVHQLRAGGMFALREAVEIVAAALDVSRFTIYNYLNELAGERQAGEASPVEHPEALSSERTTLGDDPPLGAEAASEDGRG